VTDTMRAATATDSSVAVILETARIVMRRLGPDALSLTQVARISLVPLARIYQYFPDRNALLGALSVDALGRLGASRSAAGGDARQVDRVVDRFAGMLDDDDTAHVVLCAPFDAQSAEARIDAVHRLGLALGPVNGDPDTLDYAAELVIACLRHSYLAEGSVTPAAVEMAKRAVRSFV
jgi:AcrR family transcriptional regulator